MVKHMKNPTRIPLTYTALGIDAFAATEARSRILNAHIAWMRAQDPRWQLERY
jgi:hypothetical protein